MAHIQTRASPSSDLQSSREEEEEKRLERERWLDEIIRLAEAARIRNVNIQTIRRDAERKGQLLRLGTRALGIRRRHALLQD
jgi:hypothetical protein